MCLNKIDLANSIHKIDIIYEIPASVYRCVEYESVECLAYLEERLRKLYMDTLILSGTSIFISWSNVEGNKNSEIDKISDKKVNNKLNFPAKFDD